jgi:hypothetical protein
VLYTIQHNSIYSIDHLWKNTEDNSRSVHNTLNQGETCQTHWDMHKKMQDGSGDLDADAQSMICVKVPWCRSSGEHLHHAWDCGIAPKYLILIMLLEIINPMKMLNCILHEKMDVMLCYVHSGPDRIFNRHGRTTTVNRPYFSVASLFILVQRFCVNILQIFDDCTHCGICKIQSLVSV